MPIQSVVIHLESPYREYESKQAPARDVVLVGLKWDTPWWPELAVGWLEQGMPVDAEIAGCLEEIESRTKWPQRFRHLARALRRAWLDRI